jgi:cell wall-associated NlpC family hydrolase
MLESLFRSRGWMVAGLGRAAVSAGGTAAPPNRRQVLGLGLAATAALALAGCASKPRRPAPLPAEAWDEAEDLDPAAMGAGAEVVMQALANVGKPYRWGGSDPAEGFDCSGLVAHVYDDALGMKLPRTSRAMSQRGSRVARSELAAGDLVFFNTSRRAYSHVGIYIGKGRFVHAPSSGSVVRVERLGNRYWSNRFNGARRLVID